MSASNCSLSRDSVALVVESDPSLRRLMSTILRQTGYRVRERATASVAETEQGDDGVVQLLVVGLHLAGGNGLDVARNVWLRNPNARIIVTGAVTPEEKDLRVVRDAGMTFLSLPCSFARLSRAASLAAA